MGSYIFLHGFTFTLLYFINYNPAVNVCTDITRIGVLKRDTKLVNATFYTITNTGLMGCARQCLLRNRCKSFNFDLDQSECQLNEMSTHDTFVGNIIGVLNSVVSNIGQWPAILAGVCMSHNCPENSVCLGYDNGTTFCKIECTDPPSLDKGEILTNPVLHDVGSTLDFSCFEGYGKTGDAVCKSDGQWSSFKCVQITCSAADVTNVKISTQSKFTWPVGTTLNFTCPSGSVKRGDLFCRSNSTWSIVKCEQGCTDPPNVVNAVNDNLSGTYPVGTLLNYTCELGHMFVGQVTCQMDLSWSSMECRSACVDPPVISHGTVQSPGQGPWPNGTVLNYTCDPIFRKSEENLQVECLEAGIWSVDKCLPVRGCKHIKACNISYGDGEYWMYPQPFDDALVRIYCHELASNKPAEFITLPGENVVIYSDTQCEYDYNFSEFSACKSTRFNKVGVGTYDMKSLSKHLNDLTFINATSCDQIRMATVFDCSSQCVIAPNRTFRVDTSQTGLVVDPDQTWTVDGSGAVVIARSYDIHVITGSCQNKCDWCYPTGHSIKYVLDTKFRPPIESATAPICP